MEGLKFPREEKLTRMGVISRLGASLGAVALSFCVAEGLLRLLSPPPPEFFTSAIDITSIDENAGTQRGLFIQTEEGMRLRPGATFSQIGRASCRETV